MPYDPVLTAIAASTNDALTDHLWRFDATDGDPISDIAAAVHRAAHDFTTAHHHLHKILNRVQAQCGTHRDNLTHFALALRPHTLDLDALTLIQLGQRHDTQRDALLATYQVWRRHRPIFRDQQVRHLLVRPYQPRFGMVNLTAAESSGSWFVAPDPVAAEAFGLRTSGKVIGEIRPAKHGSWQATAFTHPEHRTTCPHLVYPLPVTTDEAIASRSLLRWWALRDSEQWQGRIPAELSAEEQAALAA